MDGQSLDATLSTADEETMNPKVAEAIRALQAERDGVDAPLWNAFSQHTQS
jgi:hypothetical protein